MSGARLKQLLSGALLLAARSKDKVTLSFLLAVGLGRAFTRSQNNQPGSPERPTPLPKSFAHAILPARLRHRPVKDEAQRAGALPACSGSLRLRGEAGTERTACSSASPQPFPSMNKGHPSPGLAANYASWR